jgi:excisionase family DNA binding protein
MRFNERAACTIREAKEYGGLSNRKIYELIADGRLDSVKVDRRRLVKVASLLRLLGEDDNSPPDRKHPGQRRGVSATA